MSSSDPFDHHHHHHHQQQQQQEFTPQATSKQEDRVKEGQSGSFTPIESSRSASDSTFTYSGLPTAADSSRSIQSTLYPSFTGNTASTSSTTSGTPTYSWGLPRQYSVPNPTQLYHVTAGRSISLPNEQRNQAYLNVPNPFQFPESSLGATSTTSIPSYQLSSTPTSIMNQERGNHTLHRGASADSTQGFQCPNCSKIFARDDLLRRHLTREARAHAQPAVDRQKSCYECARSKSRCDLEVPSCGRCKLRGKTCVYGARSGNPNVRRTLRDTQEPSGEGSSNWGGSPGFGASNQWTGSSSPGYSNQMMKEEGRSVDDYESDDSHSWQADLQQYRTGRATSTSSNSTAASYDPQQSQQQQQQQHSFNSNYSQPYQDVGPGQSGPHASHLARGGTDMVDVNDGEGEVTPVNRTNVASLAGPSTMGPPQVTPTRYRDLSMNFGSHYWDPSPGAIHPQRQLSTGEMQRPQPPRLLTGAKMPKPQGRPGVEPTSGRPLFSAQLDLSGWLEEPVIPSPLYRMGPSLSALAPIPGNSSLPPAPSPGGAIAEALRNALSAGMPLPISPTRGGGGGGASSSDTFMDQQRHISKAPEGESQVAARQWWAHASSMPQSEVQIQGVAQACAGHFTIYPALMVLPDPTSPVPPLFHRPWLASTRLHTPASLARTRVLLAGYHVKLPSSENMVWEMIANEANNLVASFDQYLNASDLEVFSSTAALWFLVILLLMSSDPNKGSQIQDSLVDSSLIGLSQFSRLLSQRINACQERRKSQSSSISFLEWGFEETMKRTLFASYSLLVLQRFRETSTEIQSQLAGIDLILNISLPATAMEFEAGSELEWRASQHVQINEPPPEGVSSSLTIQDLINARKVEGGPGNISKDVVSYFDRHDDFTNVCLSVAFALDKGIF